MQKLLLITLGIICIPMMAWAQGTAVIKGTAPDSRILGQGDIY